MSNLFDLESKAFRRSKNLTVRLHPQLRQRLDLIASEKHWQLSQMVQKMIVNFIEEYDKLPKPKQTQFDFQKSSVA